MESPHGLDLQHMLESAHSSFLSLAATNKFIFSGSQSGNIHVWDRHSLKPKVKLRGHAGSVLALEVVPSKEWLFSSSGDSTVRIWSTQTLQPLSIIHPYHESDAGDLFCLTYSLDLDTLFIGCQNASIQWIDLSTQSQHRPAHLLNIQRRYHKFFDSFPQIDRRPPGEDSPNATASPTSETTTGEQDIKVLHIPATQVFDYAHYGYIYCMTIHSSNQGDSAILQLITGSGDETIKIWGFTNRSLTPSATLEGSDGAILSLLARSGSIYAGCQGGTVKVWDIETRTLIRTVAAPENSDILSLAMFAGQLYASSSNGIVQRWSSDFEQYSRWQGHDGIVLSSIVDNDPIEEDHFTLLTGANDGKIKFWRLPVSKSSLEGQLPGLPASPKAVTQNSEKLLMDALTEFVSIRSVSLPTYRDNCRQGAVWLAKHLAKLGAESKVIETGIETNPHVLATFSGTQIPDNRLRKPRILFYGHYDVVPASDKDWTSPPFELTSRNGYLYGRGVSDNKGPILAFAHAASDLLRRQSLDIDLVMLIEGEEEADSQGFALTVQKHKHEIGPVDIILISNSYWIGEDRPCITYGLRGIVKATVEISSQGPDLHSGMEGGAAPEAMFDMLKLLHRLSDGAKIAIPHFYDRVRSISSTEESLYEMLSSLTQRSAPSLASTWAEPSLTVHSVDVSGPKNATVIPATIRAQISVRIVPDQKLEEIISLFVQHVEDSFLDLQSPHRLKVTVDRTADWWLGDVESQWFKALESSIEHVWNVEPLRIREGGSIPSIPWLEKEFQSPVLHLPMGQNSDHAHLQDERIAIDNLFKGKAVAGHFLGSVLTHWKSHVDRQLSE